MPFQKGHKLSKGRPKGAKNLFSLPVEELASNLNCNPLEVLIKFAAGDWEGLGYESEYNYAEMGEGDGKVIRPVPNITPRMRMEAAEKLSKYFYSPKQQNVNVSGNVVIKAIIEDYTKDE